MRVASPVYGLARDAVLCAVAGADGDNSLFLRGLAISGSSEIRRLFGYGQPPAAPSSYRLRIIAKLDEDGRSSTASSFPTESRYLPSGRHLSPDASPGRWRISSDVEVDGRPIGRIRTRWLDDGRVGAGLHGCRGGTITPDIRYLSADIPAGVWLRSGEIEVTLEPMLE